VQHGAGHINEVGTADVHGVSLDERLSGLDQPANEALARRQLFSGAVLPLPGRHRPPAEQPLLKKSKLATLACRGEGEVQAHRRKR